MLLVGSFSLCSESYALGAHVLGVRENAIRERFWTDKSSTNQEGYPAYGARFKQAHLALNFIMLGPD